MKTLDPGYERKTVSDIEDDDLEEPLAISPTEEALEDLLSIIPQVYLNKQTNKQKCSLASQWQRRFIFAEIRRE